MDDYLPNFRKPLLSASTEKTISESNEFADEEEVQQVSDLAGACQKVREEVGRVIVGQEEIVEQVLIGIFAGGHCLLEGAPGLAKTMLVQTLAKALDLKFKRIQFTPDLMPADITGTEIIQEDPETGKRNFVFHEGPLFAQMVLADEINRTPPKTQAALLQAMQEHRITAGNRTYDLAEPFFVLATQNPIEQEGTYPLPEAQRDRFFFHLRFSYPSREEEREVIRRTTGNVEVEVAAVLSCDEILAAQALVRKVAVPDHIMDYVLDLVRSTRPTDSPFPFVRDWVEWGAGPRACQNLILGGKVRALLSGRVFVRKDDVRALAHPILRHRIVPTFQAEADGVDTDQIVSRLLEEVEPEEVAGF